MTEHAEDVGRMGTEGDDERQTQPERESGVVIEALPNALYRVELESKTEVVAHVTGAPRRNFVRILIGDRVAVAVSPRNRTRGRITRRLGREG